MNASIPATSEAAPVRPAALDAPVHVGAVTLRVTDLPALTAFYRDAIGLALQAERPAEAVLGVDGLPLLRLVAGGTAPRSAAGLFHLAILVPSRADLADWLAHVAELRLPLQGASDHLVSEALYLDDPEGNGIEIYRDRPAADWPRRGGAIAMATERLDLPALLGEASGTPYRGLPAGTCMGHVHLRVGDVAAAERFYRDALGFDVTAHYPGAAFLSAGGYHHHIAANIWGSRGAGRRGDADRGLAAFEIVAADTAAFAAMRGRMLAAGGAAGADGGVSVADPWGNRLDLVRA